MKYLNTLCIVSCLMLLSACNNDERSSISPNSNSDGTFLTATINGEKFSSSVKIVTYGIKSQTYLTTADNPDSSEFAFVLIIENNKDDDLKIIRSGFMEKEDTSGENKTWKLPDNFDFTSSVTESGDYLEGTFSFIANSFDKGIEDSDNQLVIVNGKFKAITTQGMRKNR
ncbi:hypothetical protein MNBD_GAMMA03-1308 [hydrothermal vent metagenome]|uniref:Lipoprotein n=1 Tax=hydrothermal vent metagenome TaxID=652676 RepID=A0A3B0VY65_9ZZZZ